jgi:murein DD-endopeptidase MepM/ murein hydrolase activator NlpD
LQSQQHHLQFVRSWGKRHSRSLSAGFVVLLAGFAAAAFGVDPLLPDAAPVPQRLVIDRVEPQGVRSQLDALAEHDLELWRSELTRGSDTSVSLLRRLGVADGQAAEFLRRDSLTRQLFDGQGGKMVQARATADGALVELVARYAAPHDAQNQPRFTRLSMVRADGQWRSRIEIAPIAAQVRLASGKVSSSLFAATDAAGIPDAVASQLSKIFATELDFHRELKKGDAFNVVYEVLAADGEAITWMPATGRVLSAEFVINGKSHHAVWYTDSNGRGAYFGLDGKTKRRSFLASPVEFSRVTSGFAVRFDPFRRGLREHRGVDYAAPTGTPVRTVGSGVVEYAGRQSGYGNVVIVRHTKERSTLYAHLSRIEVQEGQQVSQGQNLGAVGSTGWATGPHLHFEFLINGQHVDPLQIAGESEPVIIEQQARARFSDLSRNAKAQLDVAETLLGSRQLIE